MENNVGAKLYSAIIPSEEDETIRLGVSHTPDNYFGSNDLIARYFDKTIIINSTQARIEDGVNFKFDDGVIISLTPSTDFSNGICQSDDAIIISDEIEVFSRLMNLLRTSKTCRVQITTNKGINTYTFNVAGLQWTAF